MFHVKQKSFGQGFVFRPNGFSLSVRRGERDEEFPVVVVRGFVAPESSAFPAAVGDDKAALRIGIGADRVHDPPAVRRTVSRIDVEVQGAETAGTVVPGGIAERRDVKSAVRARKSGIVFRKAFVLHFHLISPSECFT